MIKGCYRLKLTRGCTKCVNHLSSIDFTAVVKGSVGNQYPNTLTDEDGFQKVESKKKSKPLSDVKRRKKLMSNDKMTEQEVKQVSNIFTLNTDQR